MSECRLCKGQTNHVWRRPVLRKYDVDYFECGRCGSLQTEAPYWLDEAYGSGGTGADTGACQRSIDTALTMSKVLELLDFPRAGKCLDYGAGTGLYARMMRDRGWDYFSHDRYMLPFYMDEFVSDIRDGPWDLISSFEVFEHLPNPAESLSEILQSARHYVFFSTELWQRQGFNWHYLAPTSGHHVFFYTDAALHMTARTFGLEYHNFGFIKCFTHPSSRERVSRLNDSSLHQKIMESFLMHERNPYVFANIDSKNIISRMQF
jgi:SAM-dependent methyltransferase